MNSPYQSTGFDTRVTLGAEYQTVLRTCNLNMVHLFATAATSGDPVAAAILGTDESVLAEFKTTRLHGPFGRALALEGRHGGRCRAACIPEGHPIFHF